VKPHCSFFFTTVTSFVAYAGVPEEMDYTVRTFTHFLFEFQLVLLYLFRGHNISPPRATASVGSCTTPWTPFTREEAYHSSSPHNSTSILELQDGHVSPYFETFQKQRHALQAPDFMTPPPERLHCIQ
jgi:hypothetical protein